jgi:hypothetical protein
MDARMLMKSLFRSGKTAYCTLRFGVAAWACGLIVALVAQGAVTADDGVLSMQRWSEPGFGLSLRPPVDAQKVEYTTDGALVKYLAADGYTLSVFIRKSEGPLDAAGVKSTAMQQIQFPYPSALVVRDDKPEFEQAGRAGTRVFFLIPDAKNEDWIFGQTFLLIDSSTVAVLQLETKATDFERHRQVVDAVVASIEVMDPLQLQTLRSEWIAAGEAFRRGIDLPRVKQSLRSEQWLRVMQGDEDVGYMRIRQREDTALDSPGLRVDVESRIIDGTNIFDTASTFFASDDGATEIWSVKTGQRKRLGLTSKEDPLARVESWTETGLRSGAMITVSRSTPSGIHEAKWPQPPRGYLSQVELQLLPSMMAGLSAGPMAFYAFSSETESVAFRMVRIDRLEGGGYQLTVRPAPEHPEQVSVYDGQGRLLRREHADGRVLLASEPTEIKAIWGLR